MSKETLEELLKLLDGEQEAPKAKNQGFQKGDINFRINWFIKDSLLTEGEYKTPNYLLYYAFSRFTAKHKIKTMGKEGFFRGINKRFKSKRDGRTRYYMTNFNETNELTANYLQKAKNKGRANLL